MMEEKKWAKKVFNWRKRKQFCQENNKKKISIKLNEIQEKKEMGNRIKKKSTEDWVKKWQENMEKKNSLGWYKVKKSQ